jgi:hypothetical protein
MNEKKVEKSGDVAFGVSFGGRLAHKIYGMMLLSPLITGAEVYHWTGNGKYAVLSWAINMIALLLFLTCPAWEKKHDT